MDKLNILIVEDETIIALDLKYTIESFGHSVCDIASNPQEAIRYAKEFKPHLVFMDINLGSSINGIECYKIIKKEQDLKVIYLTAYTDDKTIDSAIETNPLAYLIKPFNDDELKAVLKLMTFKVKQSNREYKDEEIIIELNKDYYYDIQKNALFFKGSPIRLSKNEKILLNLLLEAKGNPLSYADIECNIWTDCIVNGDTLRALVYRLRAKLKFDLIQTIPSFGYKLIF